ncbi:hypothetical protein [Paracraurococcus ruber]|uniref:Uncharacterized protein n=1 Tax=Paracraurococcus ruber TaxID=77675 RepID=A0ABS1CV09_9PROT|nr:hypothetical protein [Paracraurococcus ruber]MBK1658188.1 hypothetical protein [Paracraurococcus ruber]TDG31817.1 hypothetical protein E2C05_09610 [Paracraurococcus ruber]
MTEPTATLLAFPARDEDRLRLALRGLLAALDAQAAAVAELRGELGNLSGAMGGLKESLVAYQGELGSTQAALRQAGDEARALERTADGWLAAARA